LQYHEVKLNLELNDLKNCYWSATHATGSWVNDQSAVVPSDLVSASLFVDYIYLDTDERRRFAQVSHEYLLLNKRKTVTTYQYADTIDMNMCKYSAQQFVAVYCY
jgi:hypothetical protein